MQTLISVSAITQDDHRSQLEFGRPVLKTDISTAPPVLLTNRNQILKQNTAWYKGS